MNSASHVSHLVASRVSDGAAVKATSAVSQRLLSIDALRGFVMVIMLLDHVRETFFLQHQVTDPMMAMATDPALFFTRLSSMICAPVFIALTGVSAWLYGQNHTKAEVSAFLLKRGLFLMVLEVTVIGFAWSGHIIPQTFWLQVIWAIGFCMVCLAGLIHLPRNAQIALAVVIVCGHNLLDGIRLTSESPFFAPWAMLHQRDVIQLGGGLIAKTTYPVLPWIGVMLLGYIAGPWFAKGADAGQRQKQMLWVGGALLFGFVILRALNIYGDKPWSTTPDALHNVMAFMALTKYPPSLLFLMPTLGLGLVLLSLFEKLGDRAGIRQLVVLGGAPMFFYILHLLVLKALYTIGFAIWGGNQGNLFGVTELWPVWVWWLALIVPLYFPARWFSNLKKRRKDLAFLRYL